MNKKNLFIGIGILGLLIFLFLGYKIINVSKEKNEINEKRSEIRAFNLNTMNGEVFTHKDLNINRNALFVFYDSGCEICQIEADEFSIAAKDFKATDIYFISIENIESMLKFREEKKLNQNNIKFLHDGGTFSSDYSVHSYPFIILYDKNGKLIKSYRGGVKPELILKDAEEVY